MESTDVKDVTRMVKQLDGTGDEAIDSMLRRCVQTMATKGLEYTGGSGDRLANFRGVGQDIDVPMEKSWYIFFNKGVRAIQSYIRNGCQVKSNETIHDRIMDAIVFLLLFEKMTMEIEETRADSNEAEKRGG